MSDSSPIDRLSSLLERFRVRAQLAYSGTFCGVQHFDAACGHGYLHVLRRGQLEVNHPAGSALPAELKVEEPSLLFYPAPVSHTFINPPKDGADFTCAAVSFEDGQNHPLVRALPPLVVLPLAQVEGLAPLLALLFDETDRIRCGQRLMVDRLFELVLLQILRWLLDHADSIGVNTGLLAGLSEPRIARALVAIHEAPERAWALEQMAQAAGMSRTAFANTFRRVVGQTPADYLTDWRMALAKAKLREGRPIKLLADELGYANPSALSRAFLARTGHSPREWLKSVGASEAAGQPQ